MRTVDRHWGRCPHASIPARNPIESVYTGMAATTLGPVLAPFERKPEALIPLLQAVQEHLGYLPPEALGSVAPFRAPRSPARRVIWPRRYRQLLRTRRSS